ncbi:aminotransferase class IV [Xanthobacter tagetidis]|uniref:Probable branched-chain-amino-acid aminotransferase n=1 Tax=Xanthobacter tagetidis TaxID=60216 RepID=A0A3L7AEI3_9HYPH|nr:aminotransferase class IV [Xanthobacter tagetidis]MBB6305860.1 branched-chain amino acid aminotransferase [Xanthobacter tagetidis]RLP78384.1 2-keto-4-methylthiobutyrate aminotransferase [Xanthobacter tagetidis]
MMLWLGDRLTAEEAARISPLDRGFTLGDGLFETLRLSGGAVLRLEAHLARLAAGARVLGLPMPSLDLGAALAATAQANGLLDGVLRLTLTRGTGPRGVLPPAAPSPTLVIAAAPAGPALPPARLVIAETTRRNELSPLAQVKSLNYLDGILARQEAARRGADDAVLLNTKERVAETTIANLFALIDGALVTPPLADGVLPGVMRAAVMAEGAEERPLGAFDLERAGEIFLTSALGIRSVSAIEGRALSSFATAERLRARIPGA